MSNVVHLPTAKSRAGSTLDKSVVIDRLGDGARVHMTPALTDRERQVFVDFGDVEHAREYARELTLTWGDLYRRVIDRTLGGRAHDE